MEGKNLFDPIDFVHSHPPFATHLEAEGSWISEPPVPKAFLEDFVTTIPLGEEKDQFLHFVRKRLTWDQETRATSNEIILDEWLTRLVEGML
ncbi:hypothetical protein ACJ72_06801 [Emergomyces africanus]|uniref:Uncharacterized protein n=1 Tax=Emergomyces africanus TaxID=1955775 RepID=A0A1B7NQE2_9EURO|nr:hypothetical protein ACJ72_06801 [Emergomyces africanus]